MRQTAQNSKRPGRPKERVPIDGSIVTRLRRRRRNLNQTTIKGLSPATVRAAERDNEAKWETLRILYATFSQTPVADPEDGEDLAALKKAIEDARPRQRVIAVGDYTAKQEAFESPADVRREYPALEPDRVEASTDRGSASTSAVGETALPSVSSWQGEKSFRVWLEAQGGIRRVIEGTNAVILGQCAVVDSSGPEGYQVKLIRDLGDYDETELAELLQPFQAAWFGALSANEHFAGIKAIPLHITFPGSDDSGLYVRVAPGPYRVIRAFHQLTHDSKSAREAVLAAAFSIGRRAGRAVPAALAADVAVVLGDGTLVLSHRVYREGGYYPETWSASFEEQCSIGGTWDGRDHPVDQTIEETIVRGVRDELVGWTYSGPIGQPKIYAVTIDLFNFNVNLIAVLHLPALDFDGLVRRWLGDDVVDHRDHDYLAALPGDAVTLGAALAAASPRGLVSTASKAFGAGEDAHGWQPRSQLRIACCLWLLESGRL